ncbi:NAD(P)-binding domain-containing protein [Promicromonospora sp. MEB111]|uniref:NADPH-dependent F420 reductase n=1 Tax=unclassified Promicromonospora TaxID=2647929 RepID=UPI00254DF179|nr:NAD(P)-binding domain-containing protein [Promicromonospora sp. MEB111]
MGVIVRTAARKSLGGSGWNAAPGPGVADRMTTFGIIGAGHIGSQVARLAIAQGNEVVIANSRGPETLADLVAELGPKARAATAKEAAEAADVAVVSVPLKAYRDLPVEPLAGKIVLDTNNYYWERDGHVEALDRGEATVSGLLQEHLPTSKVAKAFNHIVAATITTDGTPAGTENRRALATASDYPEAVELVTAFYDAAGFDTVSAGPLSESWRVERDRPAYGPRQNAEELKENLAKAQRVL